MTFYQRTVLDTLNREHYMTTKHLGALLRGYGLTMTTDSLRKIMGRLEKRGKVTSRVRTLDDKGFTTYRQREWKLGTRLA